MLAEWVRRLHVWFSRRRFDRELEEEMAFHRDQREQALLGQGLSPAEARRQANISFGPSVTAREESRESWGFIWLDSFVQDLRQAWRALRRDPFLALITTVILAVCIGSNATVFSVANSVLIQPLPYPNADRIDWISARADLMREEMGVIPEYFYLRDENRIYEEVAGFIPVTANWTGIDSPEQLNGADVSASFFRVLGMTPQLGRYFSAEEDRPGAPPVLVVSYTFWRNRLQSDPEAVGKTIEFNREALTIIGVMPQGFDFPAGAQFWSPAAFNETTQSFPLSPSSFLTGIHLLARRKAGLTPEQIDADLHRLTGEIRPQYDVFGPASFRSNLEMESIPLQRHLNGNLRPALIALGGSGLLVLLIACVNLANLSLARAGARRRELAVRMALGSGRSRVIRQVLTESLVLAVPGGAVGFALAWVALDLLDHAQFDALTPFPPLSMDLDVFGFTVAVTVATSLLFGLTPAISASGVHILDALKTSDRAQATSGSARARKALVAMELGLCLILLVGAGLLTRSLSYLSRTDLGFSTVNLLTFRVNPMRAPNRERSAYLRELLDRLEQTPTFESVALVSEVPLSEGTRQIFRVGAANETVIPLNERPMVNGSLVSLDFLRTLKIPLRRGRFFDASDAPESQEEGVPGLLAAELVVVNESLARLIFAGEDPVGRKLFLGPDDRRSTWTIIGVVGDIRVQGLSADPPSTVYRCICYGDPRISRAGFIVQTPTDTSSAARLAAEQVRALDPDQPVFDVQSMEARRDRALAPSRFALILAGAFAAVAVLLAAVGVYGVLSYLVARRTREIGLRIALGARLKDILVLVMAETGAIAAGAIALGLAGAWALTRYLRSLLHGVSELDPATFFLTPLLLMLLVLAAAAGPSRRAATIEPITALREE